MTIDRSLVVVIDNFSYRSLEYDNVTLFDYGILDQVAFIDNLYDVYTGRFSGYGNYDDQIITADYGAGFYQVSADSDSWDNATVDTDFLDDGSFVDSLGNTAYYDEFLRLTRLGQSSEANVNHGDWVVEAINQTLDSPSSTEILAIDVDIDVDLESGNFFGDLFQTVNYVFDGLTYTGSALEKIVSDFFQLNDSRYSEISTENFALAGISMSIAGNPPNANESAVLEFLASSGVPFFQSAPNVNNGKYDWSILYEDVISVGAWNQNDTGALLVGSETSLTNLDIVADGTIEKAGWGTNFGTSFATPKVAAEWVNVLNDAIEELNASGSNLEALEAPNLENFDYSDFVNSIINTISTPIRATINGSVVEPIAVLSNTIEENGYLPKAAGSYNGLGYSVTQASAYVENTLATFSNPTYSGSLVAGTTVSSSISISDIDGNSDGIVFTGWFLDDGDLTNGVDQQLTDYTSLDGAIVLDEAWVGKTLYFTKGFEDDLGNLETSWDGTSTAGLYRVGEITIANNAPTGLVTISGTATEGQTLTLSSTVGDADGIDTSTLSYQWLRDGDPITTGTGSTTNPERTSYTLTADDVGSQISVLIHYTDYGGTVETVTSAATSVVRDVNNAPTGLVTISGTATEGQTLTLSSTVGDADGIDTSTLSYQWLRDGSAIAGATGTSYTLTQDDVRAAISAKQSYTDNFGNDHSVTSAETSAVSNVNGAPAFDIALTSESNSVATFEIYADASVDPDNDGIGAFEFTLAHDPSDLLIDMDSIAVASGFFGVPNYNATTGVLEIGGIKEPTFKDLSTPIVTFEATTLDTENPLTLTISNAIVDRVAQDDVVETFDFSSVSITATTVGRFGDDLVLSNDDVFAFEVSGGDQLFVREGDSSDTNTVVEIVANPTSEFSGLDFDLTDYAGLTDFTLSDALSNWTSQTNTTVADQVSFSGFTNDAGIAAGQETVLATFTTAIDPDFDISGIKLDGGAEPDVSVGQIPAASTNGNVTVFETARNADMIISAYKPIDEASEDAIGAYDALQALRLAVGLTKSDGTAEWHDYLAADINKDGRVGADDALDILKFAVGLTDGAPADWIFVDGDADWSGIDRRNTDYDEGVMLEDVLVDTSINMTGILVGDLDGSYVA